MDYDDEVDETSLDDTSFEEELQAEAPMPELGCTPEPNIWRPGNTYNDPSSQNTSTPIECCALCDADPRCETWSRDRLTGGCALKDAESGAALDERYDSGVIEGTDAQNAVPLGACFMEEGVAYPRGDVLLMRRTGSMTACCEMCRSNRECFSWHRSRRSGRCVLNRNVPNRVERGRRFSGSTAI